jgi:hypothetical protein
LLSLPSPSIFISNGIDINCFAEREKIDLIAAKISRFLGHNTPFSLEQLYAAAKLEEQQA